MLRKVKGNRRIRKAEKDMDLSTGVIRNKNGRDTRAERQRFNI
jgi:hypothetical protein